MNWKTVMIIQVLSSLLAHGQDSLTNNILTTKTFRYGIYESFREFRDNAPSITDDFTITVDGEGNYLHYLLFNKKGKPVRGVYGFSDGKTVYVNAANYSSPMPILPADVTVASYLQGNYFVPILVWGKICYLEDFVARSKVVMRESIFSLTAKYSYGRVAKDFGENVAAKNPGWVIYLPDDDGYVYLLDKKTLGSILKTAAPDLYETFNALDDNKSLEVLMTFLLEFNKRNPD